MPCKHTYAFVKDQFKNKGWELLEDVYINNRQAMLCICPLGHITTKAYRDFRTNRGCVVCCNRKPITIEKVIETFTKIGYKLLTNQYVSSSTKMKYRCSKRHINIISWDNFREGKRCPTCYENSKNGQTNPNWKGGISFEPYCPIWKDTDYKNCIKERDKHTCQNPYCYKTHKKLSIHHIDYDKKNCKPNNLITVCSSCNSRANKDRNWHKDWYRSLMHKKYRYIYE